MPDLSLPHSPVATLGTLTLAAAFLVIAYAGAAGIVGHRRERPGLVTSSVYASWAFTALMTFASCLMVYAFLSHDFRIKYVARYSDTTMPLFYLLTAYWGGLDGSLMFWVWVLSLFSGLALLVNHRRHADMIGYVVATIAAVSIFFVALLLYAKNPFATFLTGAPNEGSGLNPLLQNYWMVIHPPSLYVGYVGMTIPFAFCIGALASGRLDDAWLHSVRVWVIVPWFFLSLGLVLGGLWAYEELGWGGYWAWDPVENAGLIPWFTATAFLHSAMIQERRGMLRVWNVVLVITTFFLTIFGTFMTRSGIVQSVHAFGQDNELALLFLLFMTAIVVVSMGLVVYRLPVLRSAQEFDSFLSREVAFLMNNVLLLGCAFFVLFATMFPTLSEYVMDQRITVGPPFFNRFMVPLGLLLLALTGIGPLLAWRTTTRRRLREQFLWPLVVTGATIAALALLWPPSRILSPVFSGTVKFPLALLCYGLVAFTLASMTQEFVQGARVRRRQTGSDWLTATVGTVISKRRKYGGYLVHVGIAVMFFGFIGKAYQRERSFTVDQLGATWIMDGYAFRYDDLTVTRTEHRDEFTARVSVTRDGEPVTVMTPARWQYKLGAREATTEVYIDRGLTKDLYLVLNGFDTESKQANFTVFINPLVNFVWFGFGWMAIGTVICLLPAGLADAARPRRRLGAAAGVLLAAASLLGGGTAHADAPGGGASHEARPGTSSSGHVTIAEQRVDVASQPPVVQRLYRDLVCLCGGCGREPLGECRCGFAAAEREKILALLDGELRHRADAEKYDGVVAAFVGRFGGYHVLRVPPNRGFNILAWAVPYAAFAGAVVLLVVVARRWVRRGRGERPARPARTATNPAPAAPTRYDEKLDDELSELD